MDEISNFETFEENSVSKFDVVVWALPKPPGPVVIRVEKTRE